MTDEPDDDCAEETRNEADWKRKHQGSDEGVEPLWVFGKELNVVHQREVAERQPISSNLNKRGGDHGKPWHADGKDEHDANV